MPLYKKYCINYCIKNTLNNPIACTSINYVLMLRHCTKEMPSEIISKTTKYDGFEI